MKNGKCQICLVTGRSKDGRGLCILNSNLINTIESIHYDKDFCWRVNLIDEDSDLISRWILIRIPRIFWIQLKNILALNNYKKSTKTVIFTMGSIYFLPMVAAKLMRKKIVYFISGLAGSDANRKTMRLIYKHTLFGTGGYIFSTIISNLEELNYNLADIIVVESPNLARQISSNKHHNKPILNGSLFVNIEIFCPRIYLSNRANIVSYFGALNEHKGIMNFIAAIPLILEVIEDIQFVIGGTGLAFEEIKKNLKTSKIIEKVILCGNIPHEKISDYLNDARLVVLPSYGEGLPNIVLEAMACGTPVLATPVGGIPDVIKDGDTGFLMEDNSPECIATNVIRALEQPDLENVAKRARSLIEREYTIENAVVRWRKVLEGVGNDER